MPFSSSFPSLEIQFVIAWLVLLFQFVIFFAENSSHHKRNGKSARMGAFFMAGFVKKCDSGAERPPLRPLLWYSSCMGSDAPSTPSPWTRPPSSASSLPTLAAASSQFDLSSLTAAFAPSSSTPATGKKSKGPARLLRRPASSAAGISGKPKQAMLHGARLTLSA